MKLLLIITLILASQLVNCDCLEKCCQTLGSRIAQSYTFYQDTGRFTGGSGEWAIETKTYSGTGQGYLNPAKQCVANVGVLPANTYKLGHCQDLMHQTKVRPCSFPLTPQNTSKMCGRNAFFIHGCQCCTKGDTTTPPTKGCSEGCIVMNVANRMKLRAGDTLHVVSNDPKKSFLTEMLFKAQDE